jgi:type IV pilus assembly protein PilC
MIFQYTAMTQQGARLQDVVEAPDLSSARQELLQRGLLVLQVTPTRGAARAARTQPAPADRQAAPGAPGPSAAAAMRTEGGTSTTRARSGELVLFIKQLAMMLQSGASVVPALRALHEQTARPAWAAVIGDLIDRVGGGATLHDAMSFHKQIFNGTIRSLVRAGEATGQLGPSLLQLSRLLETQHRVRQKVVGALAYPIMLTVLSIGVLSSMAFFVLPRFASLFLMLDSELPWITRAMLGGAQQLKTWWPLAIGVPVALAIAGVLWARSNAGRDAISRVALRVPLLGPALSGVLMTQIMQLWGAALRSKVPLLDAIQQARDVTRNVVVQELISSLATAVEQGQSLSAALRRYPFVPRTVIAAVATGEESGKLAESCEFVGQWLEEESSHAIGSLTRLLEPALLIVMGVVVGGVAIALFLPLFDLATAA